MLDRDLYTMTIGDHTVRLQVGPDKPGIAPLVARICRMTDGAWDLMAPLSVGSGPSREIALAWLALQAVTCNVDAVIARHARRNAAGVAS